MDSYSTSRSIRQIAIGGAGLLITAGLYAAIPTDFVLRRVALSTGYSGSALLALTLLVGPWNVLRGRPNPVSSGIRRDLGIFGGILALVHTVAGFGVHMQGKFWLYFVYPAEAASTVRIRLDGFGIANYAGLVSSLILLMLLALSNDASLRRLGGRRWKSLQRWNYAAFGLMAVHGVVYQVLTRRPVPLVGAFVLMAAVTTAIQVAGYWMQRRERPAGR